MATEAEIDRGCGEWIGLVVWATRAGLRPAPYWRIGVEEASNCNSMDEPGTNFLRRGALTWLISRPKMCCACPALIHLLAKPFRIIASSKDSAVVAWASSTKQRTPGSTALLL